METKCRQKGGGVLQVNITSEFWDGDSSANPAPPAVQPATPVQKSAVSSPVTTSRAFCYVTSMCVTFSAAFPPMMRAAASLFLRHWAPLGGRCPPRHARASLRAAFGIITRPAVEPLGSGTLKRHLGGHICSCPSATRGGEDDCISVDEELLFGSTRVTTAAHRIFHRILRPGDSAVDATAGNGHDSLLMAQLVGPEGSVTAVDVQPQASNSVLGA